LDKEGSPYLDRLDEGTEQLNPSLPYQVKGVRQATAEEAFEIKHLRKRLDRFAVVRMGLYPYNSCWASNLLYVAHHRDQGRSNILDQPLKNVNLDPKDLAAFSDETHFPEWIVRPSADLILEQSREEAWRYCLSLNTFHLDMVPKLFDAILKEPNGISIEALSKATKLSMPELQSNLFRLSQDKFIELQAPTTHQEAHGS